MKNIIFNLTAYLLLFSIESCTTEAEEIDRQYQLINTSEVDIKIKFYNTFSNTSTLFETQIEPNGIFLGDILTYRSGNDQLNEENSFYPSSAYKNSDSLVVIFDEIKQITLYYTPVSSTSVSFSEPINRNLFRHGNYEKIENERFQFKIIQQDYENAEDCNGNCE